MRMPLPELLDRLSILTLKIQRIGEPHLQLEYDEVVTAIEEFELENILVKEEWFVSLLHINQTIWDLEAAIRQGKEDDLGLEEVGRRALLIRDTNKCRVSIKNTITQETGSGFIDVKQNHISQ